jgi:hypothetical protein
MLKYINKLIKKRTPESFFNKFGKQLLNGTFDKIIAINEKPILIKKEYKEVYEQIWGKLEAKVGEKNYIEQKSTDGVLVQGPFGSGKTT